MSSGSSGRYQSRIFNFVHQQSRRLTEQVGNTIRYVQVATKWGAEALLYPVYMWLQSSQSSQRTLDGQPTQTKPQLEPQTPPAADTPIVNVLETVKNLPFADDTATPSNDRLSLPNPLDFLEVIQEKIFAKKSPADSKQVSSLTIPENQIQDLNHAPMYSMVRGIATNIEKRNLLLVTTNNEILDILTPQQQVKLEAKIINEVSHYWHSGKLLAGKKQANPLPEIERLLAKLTGNNPQAIPALPESIVNESSDLCNYQKTLTFLDTAVANLEAKALVPIQQRSQEMIHIAQTQLNIFLYGKEQLTAKGEITASSDELTKQSFNFEALIEAALNYFLGVGHYKKLDISDREIQATGNRLINSRLGNQDVNADAWLTWSDLYGESEAIGKPSIKSAVSSSAITSLPQNVVKNQHKSAQNSKSKAGMGEKSKKSRYHSQKHQKSAKVTSNIPKNLPSSQQKSDRQVYAQIEAKPDWIETKATFVGYEKHILQRILEFIDSIMVLLETIFVNLMMFLRGFLGVK
ncbi:hypothetical protein H6G41_29440 [Tolypothrix sp. FACHB-123]|uniref:hypothetical protein n=1 Tax=Tolypothrix sp. FACHB-123 TaxID=2692868 RepID=UPI001683B350|nr:hypothetical protein [Tolypothrix sp. FACHB-123]MBD2358673.1 hypothetical protein [Tolypothrix sp. FACHB-123]